MFVRLLSGLAALLLHLPTTLGATSTFSYNTIATGPSKPGGLRSWPPSYPPALPLWALGPYSPYKPRRMFEPFFGGDWLSTTTTTPSTTSTTTPRPFVPFSSCSHLPTYCTSYFTSASSSPLPTQCIDVCSVDDVATLQVLHLPPPLPCP